MRHLKRTHHRSPLSIKILHKNRENNCFCCITSTSRIVVFILLVYCCDKYVETSSFEFTFPAFT